MEVYWDYPSWDHVDPLPMDGLYRVCKDGKWGCVDKNRMLVIPFRWEFIGHIHGDLIFVKEKGLWGILRRNGTFAAECKWKTILPDPQDSRNLIFTNDTETCCVPVRSL